MERRLKIGIIDDEPDVRDTLSCLLHENGYDGVPMAGSDDFYALGTNPDLDLVLIDLKLKGESGLTLASQIRDIHDMPIVMLTGTGDETDKIVGLETGADDYVMKPFNPRELLARIRAILRRCGAPVRAVVAPADSDNKMLGFGDKMLDIERRQLLDAEGETIALTNAEYQLLEYLVTNPDRIVPRLELLEKLGADLTRYVDRTIDVLILRLRRKIEPVPSKPVHLQTRRGQGYIFVRDGSAVLS